MSVRNVNKVDYVLYHRPIPSPQMSLKDKLQVHRLSAHCALIRQKRKQKFSVFGLKKSFILTIFGIQRKHDMKPVGHYILETHKLWPQLLICFCIILIMTSMRPNDITHCSILIISMPIDRYYILGLQSNITTSCHCTQYNGS